MSNNFLNAKEVLPGIYAITGEAVVRYLIIGKERAVLFDTGHGFTDLNLFVRTLTDLPLDIVISHGHVDHAGANFYFTEDIYMHSADLEVYKQHQTREFRKVTFQILKDMQKNIPIDPFAPEDYTEEDYMENPVCQEFKPIKEGDRFDLGDLTLEVVEIPGHTKGSIGLYCGELKTFLASDGINGGTWLFLPESCEFSVYLETLKKAYALEFDYLLTGHSFELIPKSKIADYIEVAENLDFENGQPVTINYTPEIEVRICFSKYDTGEEKKACVFVSKDKLLI